MLEPIPFTENSQIVWERRYLTKDDNGNPIETIEERIWSMCMAVAMAEKIADGFNSPETIESWAKRFYNELFVPQKFMPNSPTVRNAGREGVVGGLQACVVASPEDNLHSIYQVLHDWGLTEKYGAGIGGSFDAIRERGSHIGTIHGEALGPVAVMKIYSESSKWITQGVFREGAHMAVLNVDHPDIRQFIHCKDECKGPTDILFNFNISVAITDAFMDAVRKNETWNLISRTKSKSVVEQISARNLWEEICDSAWKTGDPGCIFIDRIRETEPNPYLGKIMSTNPCGEEPLENYGSCNLGSINLMKFADYHNDGYPIGVKWEELSKTINLAIRFLDNVITINEFPPEVPKLKELNIETRRIGLGVMGWHDLLVILGIPYESDKAVHLAETLSAFITEHAWKASEKLGQEKGNFPGYKNSRVREQHALSGARNSNVTTIAPTGTISIILGASSGIEPYPYLVAERQALWSKGKPGAILLEIPEVLKARLSDLNIEIEQVFGQKSSLPFDDKFVIEFLPEEERKLYRTANEIDAIWHVRHLAAWQKFITNGVSKTINMAFGVSPDDVNRAMWHAYEMKCKAVTIYRDGSKDTQILTKSGTTSETDTQSTFLIDVPVNPITQKRPQRVDGYTEGVETGHGKIYITVNSIEEQVFEIFSTVGKTGSCDEAQVNALTRMCSLSLRSGINPMKIVEQLRGISCCPAWFEGRQILSIPDAIAFQLNKHLEPEQQALMNQYKDETEGPDSKRVKRKCQECGQPVVYSEGCVNCPACGWNKCD